MMRCRVVVSGRVQGVWFRESCRREATALDVAGWVRNTGDGKVEAVLEGDRDAVEKLVAWMRVGPPHARVTDVETSEEPASGEQSFTVR
jgi:acylphosphatase